MRAALRVERDDPTSAVLPALAFAILATSIPVLSHTISPLLAVAVCLAAAVLATMISGVVVITTLVTFFLFQNAVVAVLSPLIASKQDFNIIRAYNFAFLASVWAVLMFSVLASWRTSSAEGRRLLLVSSAPIVVIVLYFAIGLRGDPMAATVYLRNMVGAYLCFQIALIIGMRSGSSTLNGVLAALPFLGWTALAYGYAELLFDFDFLRLFNGDVMVELRLKDLVDSGYWLKEMRETGFVVRDPSDMLRINLFNSALFKDWGIRLYRPNGPNFHSISFAYAIVFCGLVSTARGRPLFLAASLPLLLTMGAKGALVVMLIVLSAMLMVRVFKMAAAFWMILAMLGAYAVAAFIIGIRTGDYHVLGFLGGVNGMLSNPLGHGLGSSGNLSIDMSRIDWSRAQKTGGTLLAVESAIGVMLFQLGIGTAVVVGFNVWLATHLKRLHERSPDPLVALATIGILTITVNGIFQEEALFSPLAIGVMMLLAGLVVGMRTGPVRAAAPGASPR